MRVDPMVWVQRVTGAVFAVGVIALLGMVWSMLRHAQGIPPMPIFLGVVGLVALILLAGACLAAISIAVSARQGVEALRRLSHNGVAVAPAPQPKTAVARVFSGHPLRDAQPEEAAAQPEARPEPPAAPPRPARPAGRRLVAER